MFSESDKKLNSDILLLQTKQDYFDFAEGLIEPPLGLLAIAGPCIKKGFSVKIIDQRIESLNWGKEIMSILKSRPICVGMGSMTGPQLFHVMETAKWIKKNFPNQTVVLGGPHATIQPELMVSSPYIDIVVTHEGEETFVELVEALSVKRDLKEVKNILFVEDDNIVKTPYRGVVDINSLEVYPYHLIDMNSYRNNVAGKKAIKMYPDRGCPYKCSFCGQNEYYQQKRYRHMSAANIMKHIKAVASMGVEVIGMGDGAFLSNKRRLSEILEFLKKENLELEFQVSARVDDVNRLNNDELIRLREAGFLAFQVGAESGSNRVLELMNKRITVEDTLLAHEKLKKAGIVPMYSFMGGVPGETLEDGQKTLDLMVKLYETYSQSRMTNMQLYRLLPGQTKFWDIAQKEYNINAPSEIESCYNLHFLDHPWLTEKELAQFKKWDILSWFVEIKSIVEYIDKFWMKFVKIGLFIYSKIIRFRIKHKFYFFMPELRFIKWIAKL